MQFDIRDFMEFLGEEFLKEIKGIEEDPPHRQVLISLINLFAGYIKRRAAKPQSECTASNDEDTGADLTCIICKRADIAQTGKGFECLGCTAQYPWTSLLSKTLE